MLSHIDYLETFMLHLYMYIVYIILPKIFRTAPAVMYRELDLIYFFNDCHRYQLIINFFSKEFLKNFQQAFRFLQ